ncbi:MAG: leucyl aminopeptidase, partial [Arcobacter sp.]|nr:leucyl aminopeptidase [Arcobacter sp.]
MKINILEKNDKLKSEVEIIFVKELDSLTQDKELLEILDFKAKDEACVLLAESKKIYVGYEKDNYDCIAIAIATAIKKLQTTKFKSANIVLNQELKDNFKALVEGAILGEYKFTDYKSEKEKRKIELDLIVEEKNSSLEKILNDSKIIAKAVNKARNMVNTAPADF